MGALANTYRPFLQQSQAADEAAQRAKARAFVEQVERERATQAVAAIPTTSPPPKKKLIYKKWWFWTALGAVVVTGSLAIILGTQVDPRPVPMTLVDFRGKI